MQKVIEAERTNGKSNSGKPSDAPTIEKRKVGGTQGE
jgi:hypothetical protein